MVFAERNERLIAKFDGLGIDGFVILPPSPSHGLIPNIFYLTGFSGSTAVAIIGEDKRFFLTDSRYTESVGDSIGGYEVVENTGKPFLKLFPELNGELGIKRLGVEAGLLPVGTYNRFVSDLGPVEIVPVENAVENLRMEKDADEIELVKKAIRINEESFLAIVERIASGTRECDLAAEFEYALRKRGGDMASFSPIVASGPNSSKPHAGFTGQPLVPGAPLTIDIGVAYKGYCSDMTRTVFVKDCPRVWRERYDAVLEGKRAAEAGGRAGMTGTEVDAMARGAIEGLGYAGHCFTHGLGHSIGIEVHENPRFARGYDEPIPEGVIMSVEPGIYVPGEGGIRIEDLVLVTGAGCENLNNLSCELVTVG